MKNIKISKNIKKKLISICLTAALACPMFSPVFTEPVSVQAAVQTASNLDELAEIVRKEGMARNEDFTVTFEGTDREWKTLFGERIDFFYYTMVTKDDPTTSDDADYLVGNIDFSKDTMQAEKGKKEIRFTLTYFESADETRIVNKTTKTILKELGVEGKTDYEKTKLIHDYVCRLITYMNDVDTASSVYSAYTRGEGLCNSYALCMYKLLTEAKVPCKWIGGSAGTGRDAEGHAWNLVRLGNLWYHLDATWDDLEDGIVYDYFLKGSKDFDEKDPKRIHTMDDEYYETDYLKMFPIAETAYEKNMSNTGSANKSDNYKFSELVIGRYPDSGKASIKKGKMEDIQLVLSQQAVTMVDHIQYKIIKGKNLVKVKNLGLFSDHGVYFEDLEVKGLKKGTAKIRVTVYLKDGRSKNYLFTMKIK